MQIKSRAKLSVYSLALALVVGGVIIALVGKNPFATYGAVLSGSFGSFKGFMGVLAYATPLILTGLGGTVAFQGGVFNIGGEGQLLIGGLAAVVAGIYIDLPWPFPLLIALGAGFFGGAVWALIPTVMVGRNPTSLFVATVMMNSIGSMFSEYLAKYHFPRPGASTTETENILPGAVLPRLNANTQLTYGFFLAVALVFVVAWFLYRTRMGFAIRIVGANPLAAGQAGINVFSKTLFTMFISGGICGLAGAVQCLGLYNRWIMGFSPGYGWDGITVATLAALSPFAILLTGTFFGMLRSASVSMNLTGSVPIDMVTVLQGLIVVFVASPTLWTTLKNMRDNFAQNRRRRKLPVENGEGTP